MTYVIHGRCRSGSRWFWIAAELGEAHKCEDPVCVYGGPHECGWEDTEDLALKAMAGAVARLGGEVRRGAYRGNAPGSAGAASSALKRINAAKRATRPPSGGTGAGVVEYLYAAYSPDWVDDMTGKRDERVIPFQITRKTARRIYYIRRAGCPEWNDPPVIGFISRQEFEVDARCPGGRYPERCEHDLYHDHGDGPGEIRTNHHHDDDYHLFATPEAAEDYLFRWERERERKRKEREPELKRLRMAMADAHPRPRRHQRGVHRRAEGVRAGTAAGIVTVEPLTPLSVEQKLRQLVNDLARAQVVLREARDQEVDARHEYDRARRKALLSEKSPKVTRGGYTVAEQAAWVEEQCADLKFAADKATVVREAAQDRLRVLLAQAEVVRSLSASVRQAYELAGRVG